MIELSSEARRAYEVMVLSLEQTGQAETETEQAVITEDELQISSLAEEAEPSPDTTQPEEPEYSKLLSCMFVIYASAYLYELVWQGKTKWKL